VTNFTILTAKDWALRWIRGSIESYFIGKTPLEIVKGRIRRAVKSYNVNPSLEVVQLLEGCIKPKRIIFAEASLSKEIKS
jgi:hypothetical protein